MHPAPASHQPPTMFGAAQLQLLSLAAIALTPLQPPSSTAPPTTSAHACLGDNSSSPTQPAPPPATTHVGCHPAPAQSGCDHTHRYSLPGQPNHQPTTSGASAHACLGHHSFSPTQPATSNHHPWFVPPCSNCSQSHLPRYSPIQPPTTNQHSRLVPPCSVPVS